MPLSAEQQRSPEDAHDIVAAVHRLSIQELEQLARAERARVTANLVAAAFRAAAKLIRRAVRESRAQLAAEALAYRIRRPASR